MKPANPDNAYLDCDDMAAAYDLFGKRPKQFKHSIGYAGMIGAGPPGETCGSCKWRERHGKWNKCGHARGYTSSSEASDIRVSAPACEYWESLEVTTP